MGRIADHTQAGSTPSQQATTEAPPPPRWMPAVRVHGLREAEAVLRAAEATGGVLHGAVLLSAPCAATWPGPAGFAAVIRLARARHPGLPCRALLDCGAMPGPALRALREGWRELVLAETCPAFAQVAGAARMAGAVLHGRPPAALSLDGIDLRRPGGMAILHRWLTASPTGSEMTEQAGHG